MKTQHGQNKNKQVINEIFVNTEQDCCENTEKEVLGFAELDEGISKWRIFELNLEGWVR